MSPGRNAIDRWMRGSFTSSSSRSIASTCARVRRRACGKQRLRRLDVLAHVDAAQAPRVPVVDRHVEPGLHALGHLAAAVGRIRLEQRRHEVGPAREHFVVERHRAGDEALAARPGGLQAQQAHHVDRVGVVLELAAGLVVAHLRVVDVEPEVLDVAEQVALGVLRARAPEVRADAHVGDRLLLARVALHRKAAQHGEAAPFEQFVEDRGERLAERGQRKARRRYVRERRAARLERAHRCIQLGEFRGAELADPVAALLQVARRTRPRARNRAGAGMLGLFIRSKNTGRKAMKPLLALLVSLVVGSRARCALAQGYPSKPITFVIPFAAGGDSDLSGRNARAARAEVPQQPAYRAASTASAPRGSSARWRCAPRPPTATRCSSRASPRTPSCRRSIPRCRTSGTSSRCCR